MLTHRFRGTFRTYPRLVLFVSRNEHGGGGNEGHRFVSIALQKDEKMTRTTPGGKEKPPAEGLLLPDPEGWTVEVELDKLVLPPFPLLPFPFPMEVPLPPGCMFESGRGFTTFESTTPAEVESAGLGPPNRWAVFPL